MITAHIANQVLHVRGAGGYPPGNFFAHLIGAAFAADPINRQKIAAGFPEIAEAVVMSTKDLREIAAKAVQQVTS